MPNCVNGHPTENEIFNPFASVRMPFLSVSDSANALSVKRGPFNSAKSFALARSLGRSLLDKGIRRTHGTYALACVLFGIRSFLVLFLSTLHPLMSGGPDSQPDYYLTCNGSTRGVSEIDRTFSG